MASWWQRQETAGGYALPEMISGLQKHIRRGEEREAMECAIQIASIQPKYLWNRMRAIASEDIGPADNSITLLVDTLGRNYEDADARGNGSRRLFLAHAILAMCRAPKSRIVDSFNIAMYRETEGWYEVPDYVLDKHTPRGREMGRGVDDFLDEGTLLVNEVELDGAAEYAEVAARHLKEGREPRYSGKRDETREQGKGKGKGRRQEVVADDDATPLFPGG